MEELTILEKIEQVLDARVRSTLRSHGGDAKVQYFKDGILVIKLLGQCSACPAALSTTEDIIRAEVIAALPEVLDVELDTGVDQELLSFARKVLNHEV